MTSPLPSDPIPSGRDLRARLFDRRPAGAAASTPPPADRRAPTAPLMRTLQALSPSPAELLAASPAVVRLCESYHRAEGRLTARGRRQRLGIFLLVCAIGVGGLLLLRSGAVTASLVSDLVLAAAGASCVSVGVLALLWLRDDRRLRGLQGDRMLRAVHFNCDLPDDRLHAWRLSTEPISAFFACYDAWRTLHRAERPGGLMGALRQMRA